LALVLRGRRVRLSFPDDVRTPSHRSTRQAYEYGSISVLHTGLLSSGRYTFCFAFVLRRGHNPVRGNESVGHSLCLWFVSWPSRMRGKLMFKGFYLFVIYHILLKEARFLTEKPAGSLIQHSHQLAHKLKHNQRMCIGQGISLPDPIRRYAVDCDKPKCRCKRDSNHSSPLACRVALNGLSILGLYKPYCSLLNLRISSEVLIAKSRAPVRV